MGTIHAPLPAKLFFGMLSPDPLLLSAGTDILVPKYGPIELESSVMPWEITDYYKQEMGAPLFRKFIILKPLIDPAELAGVKSFTNSIEDQFVERSPAGMRRRINIDPGYVTEAKVILASTKDFSHRIYIGNGIYAEVTLRYSSRQRAFTPLEHTYFDFRTDAYRELFNKARELLRRQLREETK